MDWRRPTWRTLYSLSLDFLVNSAWPSLRAGVPVCPWTGAGLPGGLSTACRWTSWSTAPAFIIDLGTGCTTDTRGQYLALSKAWLWSCYYCVCGTGCTTDTAFHGRRPSVPRRCGKNLEQSAIRSDVFTVCEHWRLNSRLICFPPLSRIADCKVTVVPLAFFTSKLYCIVLYYY